MKLSEAIRLGSLTLKPAAGYILSPDKREGCAIGMAMVAAGSIDVLTFPILTQEVPCPCECQRLKYRIDLQVQTWIIHLFDNHIMRHCCPHTLSHWTLDQLCEWVASVEAKFEVKPTKCDEVAEEKANDTLDPRPTAVPA